MSNPINPQEEAKRLAEHAKRQFELQEKRTKQAFQDMELAEKNRATFDSIDLDNISENYADDIAKETQEYLEAAKHRMTFIAEMAEFDRAIPFFRKNLIGIGAVTGDGKSTVCSNIVLSGLRQGKKVLVITNEENPSDVYNRVTALAKGWHYANHDKIPESDIPVYSEMTKKLKERGMMVIGDDFEGATGLTTSLEGFRTLVSKLKNAKTKYDIVLLDYYQAISTSTQSPNSKGWEILEKVTGILENLRKTYPAPIVVFYQLKPTNQESKLSWKERIEGSKSITNRLTCALEVRPIKGDYKSEWVLHKSRFSDFTQGSFFTGWDKGRYVPYTQAFQDEINRRKLERLERGIK